MKDRLLHALILSLLAMVFTGCASHYQVRVDALSTGEGTGAGATTYKMASATPGIDEGDLFFKEVVRHLEPVLRRQGYIAAVGDRGADLLIEVDAHLSDPMVETERYSEPIYLETHGGVRTIRVPVVNAEGQVVRYSYSNFYVPPTTRLGGWVDHNRQITVYDKVLRLSARKVLGADEYSDEVWAITIALKDESTDYRAALSYMLVAAGDYIGRRTEGEEIILIDRNSEDVKTFRSSLSNGR